MTVAPQTRTLLIALVALMFAVAAFVISLTRHENPAVKLEQFAFPPELNNVNIGDPPGKVRKVMGPPKETHRFPALGETCWDYVFPTQTPHYRLCFMRGRLVMRTPI